MRLRIKKGYKRINGSLTLKFLLTPFDDVVSVKSRNMYPCCVCALRFISMYYSNSSVLTNQIICLAILTFFLIKRELLLQFPAGVFIIFTVKNDLQ